MLGTIQAGPPTFTWPALPLSAWIALIPSALALTLVTTAEGLLVARGSARNVATRPTGT